MAAAMERGPSRGGGLMPAFSPVVTSSSSSKQPRRPQPSDDLTIDPLASPLTGSPSSQHQTSTPPSSGGRLGGLFMPDSPVVGMSDAELLRLPAIRSCSVPTHSKAGTKWLYACRVVPDTNVASQMLSSSQTSLGKMELAGCGSQGAREPYTVWRKWDEFVDLERKLANAFPVVPSSPSAPSQDGMGSPKLDLPASFYRHTPRLPSKITTFFTFTRTNLLQRQDELDRFVRRLFEMPDCVKQSLVVRRFFSIRESDLTTTVTSPTLPPSQAMMRPPPLRVNTDLPPASPEPLSRGSPAALKPRLLRPGLMMKHSTPDLRKFAIGADFHGSFGELTIREDEVNNSTTRPSSTRNYSDASSQRDSLHSIANSIATTMSTSSTSSSITIKPGSPPPQVRTIPSQARQPSPLAPLRDVSPPRSYTDDDAPRRRDLSPTPRPKQALRHFRSLQDIRQQPDYSLSMDDAPQVPVLTSEEMGRAITQPIHFPSPTPAPSTTTLPAAIPVRPTRPRAGSKSSIGSLESEAMSPASSAGYSAAGARRPSFPGRRGSGFTPVEDELQQSRSLPRRGSSKASVSSRASGKAIPGHSPSPSIESTTSYGASDMSRSTSEGGRFSGRSSTDFSDMSSNMPGTPPTPHMFDSPEMGSGKIYHHEQSATNYVPLPPFFPVPPTMSSAPMQGSQSFDAAMQRTHRRPMQNRSRAMSSASQRPALETILGSPQGGGVPLVPSPTGSMASVLSMSPRNLTFDGQMVPTVLIFKVLHPDSNIALRASRSISYEQLWAQIDRKFRQSDVLLKSGWILLYATISTTKSSGDGSFVRVNSDTSLQQAVDKIGPNERITLHILEG